MKTLMYIGLFIAFMLLATWEAIIKGRNPYAEDPDL